MKRFTWMAAAGLVASIGSAHAANEKFVQFALEQVHRSTGMTQCDAAVRKVMQAAGGDDLRVETFNQVMDNTIKLLAVFGQTGSPIQVEATVRREPQACRFTATYRMFYQGSCAQYLQANPSYQVAGQSLGVTFAKTPNHVHVVLTPVGEQCATDMHVFGTVPVAP